MLKAGKYYVGDLSFLLDRENGYDWEDVISHTGNFGENNSLDSGYYDYKGIKFFCSDTYHGDGSYTDQFDRIYLVDSGTIGAFPVDGFSDESLNYYYNNIVSFKDDFDCFRVSILGHIRIGDLKIDTRHIDGKYGQGNF